MRGRCTSSNSASVGLDFKRWLSLTACLNSGVCPADIFSVSKCSLFLSLVIWKALLDTSFQ